MLIKKTVQNVDSVTILESLANSLGKRYIYRPEKFKIAFFASLRCCKNNHKV